MSSQLRSREIKDYFEAEFSLIRPGEPITFAIHLYFSSANHIIVWRLSGEEMTEAFVLRYRERGLKTIWILRAEEAAYRQYLAGPPSTAVPTVESPSIQPENKPAVAPAPESRTTEPAKPETEEAREILAAMKAPEKAADQKADDIAKVAQEVLRKSAQPETPRAQKPAHDHAKKVVREVLRGALEKLPVPTEEIWRLSDVDPAFEHAVNVSTYSVLFALSFGRIDADLLADVALAGLLHDIGISQVPAEFAPKAWKSHQPPEREQYSRHVKAGIDLIDAFAPQTSPRIRTILMQHHEKFDGSGYPQKLQGFQLDDVAQLVSMADLFDSIGSGRWDGEERALGATLDTLENLEKARTFPENFNPEVFSNVLRWTKSGAALEQMSVAVDVMKEQSRKLLDKDKSAA